MDYTFWIVCFQIAGLVSYWNYIMPRIIDLDLDNDDYSPFEKMVKRAPSSDTKGSEPTPKKKNKRKNEIPLKRRHDEKL